MPFVIRDQSFEFNYAAFTNLYLGGVVFDLFDQQLSTIGHQQLDYLKMTSPSDEYNLFQQSTFGPKVKVSI